MTDLPIVIAAAGNGAAILGYLVCALLLITAEEEA